MNDLGNFISSVGFPIAVGSGCLYAAYKVGMKLIEKALYAFEVITKTNEELVKTNSIFANRMDNIENKVDIVLNILKKEEV